MIWAIYATCAIRINHLLMCRAIEDLLPLPEGAVVKAVRGIPVFTGGRGRDGEKLNEINFFLFKGRKNVFFSLSGLIESLKFLVLNIVLILFWQSSRLVSI